MVDSHGGGLRQDRLAMVGDPQPRGQDHGQIVGAIADRNRRAG